MKLSTVVLLASMFALMITNSAVADINVSVQVGSGTPSSNAYGSDDPIVLSIPNSGGVTIRVWADNPLTEDVGHITLNNPFTVHYVTIVFSTSGGFSGGPVTPVCRHWAGLTNHLPSGTRLSGAINGNLTGSVTVDEIARFQVSGQLQSALVARSPLNELDTVVVFAGSVSESGEIRADVNDIYEVNVSGDMLGDIRAPGGTVFEVQVGGNIGSPSRLSTISGRVDANHPNKEAFRLIAADNIYANISATAGTSWLGRLETTGSPGDFVGSLSMNHIHWTQETPIPGIYLTGDLDADVTFSSVSAPIEIGGDLTEGGSLVINGTVRTDTIDRSGHVYIGGSLLGTIEIGQSEAKGVQGFIEINTNNASGVWTGPVEVRTPSGIQALADVPAYSQLSSQITESGYYGAVGLVPFQLHEVDCTPPNGACISKYAPPDPDHEILMRHYGPVYWTGSAPFVVRCRGIGTNDSWNDVSNCFTQGAAGDPSVVVLDPDKALPSGFEYLVELRQDSGVNILRCYLSFPPSTPPVADHTSDFVFAVGAASMGDVNDDGVVNFDDLNSVIANWENTDCLPEGDANRDTVIDFNDINTVIANWLSEYEDCSSGMMMMAGFGEGCDRDMDDAIAAMGFENATEYAVFLAGLSNDERAMILAAVDEWLECQR